jgi:hypothetical protein
MSSILNISCSNPSTGCNFIEPINSLNIYPDSNGISKVTGRPITGEELAAIYNSYNSICNSNGGLIQVCCKPDATIDPKDKKTLDSFNKFKNIFPSGRFITSSNGIPILQLSSRNLNSLPGWNSTIPYMMCKIGGLKYSDLKISNEPGVFNVYNIAGLTSDCSSNKCSSSTVTYDMLLSNVKQDTGYTYYDDSKVADDIKNNVMDGLKTYIYKYNYVNQPLTGDDLQSRMIHIAAEFNNLSAAQLLIAVGADINIKTIEGDTPLHIAARNNNKDIVSFLITQGASITERNNAGETPMFQAVRTGDLNMILILYNNGSGVLEKDNAGNNLCQYVILYAPSNKRELVNFFITHGVSIDEKNVDGKTALDNLNKLLEGEIEKSYKSNKLSQSSYLAIKNDILNLKNNRNLPKPKKSPIDSAGFITNSIGNNNNGRNLNSIILELGASANTRHNGINASNIVESFQTIDVIRNDDLSDSLQDLLSVQTTLRNQIFRSANKVDYGSDFTFGGTSATAVLGSPIAYDNKICVPRYGATLEEATEIIGNEDAERCKSLGGEMVDISVPSTSIAVGFYSPLDQDIAKIDENDLYNPVNMKLEYESPLPKPDLNESTPSPTQYISMTTMPPETVTMWQSIKTTVEGYSNLLDYLTILIIVLVLCWGGYYLYNRYFSK